MTRGPLILAARVCVVSYGLVGRFRSRERFWRPVRSLLAALDVARGFGIVSDLK